MPAILWPLKTAEFALSISTDTRQQIWHRIERQVLARIAAWPEKAVHMALVLAFSVWVVVDVLFLGVTGGLAQTTYDAMVRGRLFAPALDDRIVIIDIDEASLARMAKEFGRWPWPRDTLASVLDFVESQQPAAVVWDIVFSDLDRLNPGGDAAFDAAVKRSAHSHFGVVRLPIENDDKSELTQNNLKTLWAAPAAATNLSTLALIPPALPAITEKSLGFNNGYVDHDGVLRRYRNFEKLSDGGVIQSLPMSVSQSVDASTYDFWLSHFEQEKGKLDTEHATSGDVLINWRKKANLYPRVNFADVFAKAEGDQPKADVPSMQGKIVIIGATAPSLHDIHPTPLSTSQAGVDTLATGIDNVLHRRVMYELPKWLAACVAVLLCSVISWWSYRTSVSRLSQAMVALPGVLMGVSFISLHSSTFFIDLHLSAALAVLYLALLKAWFAARKRYWCGEVVQSPDQALAVWACELDQPWTDDEVNAVMACLQSHAPSARVVLLDTSPTDSNLLVWKPFANALAIVADQSVLVHAKAKLDECLQALHARSLALQLVAPAQDALHLRQLIAHTALQAWATLRNQPFISPMESL